MTAEGSLFGVEKIKPRIIDVAKRLFVIYTILTFLEVFLLFISGMNLFDAVCHSFATVATGGFSTKNSSIANYSTTIQYIIIVFMILSGINFSLHYFAFNGKFKKILRDKELRVYLIILGVVTLLISINLLQQYDHFEPAFRNALFQVSSIVTATGFATADNELWPEFSKMLLFFTMLIGACVGSTGGGIKIARHIIIFKVLRQRFKQLLNPNLVSVTKFNKTLVHKNTLNSIYAFVSIYLLTIVIGTIIMSATKQDLFTSASSIITTLGGIGPGFGKIGPTENFASLPEFAKVYLSFNMIIGRLEILPVLVLFHPSFRKM